jgi:hypothetical protein
MYAGGFKQVQYKEYICWMQVKIYISDQTSLRICNSVPAGDGKVASLFYSVPYFLIVISNTNRQADCKRTEKTKQQMNECGCPVGPRTFLNNITSP